MSLTLDLVTAPPIYIPSFNPETGLYVDICPIPARQRLSYSCMCNHTGTIFNIPSEFKLHIKLKKHIQFVEHYVENIKVLDNAIQHNKKLQADYELMYRKMTHEIKHLKLRVSELEKEKYYDSI